MAPFMVRGPAERRKLFVTESEFSTFESITFELESNERNLSQLAGTSRPVAVNSSRIPAFARAGQRLSRIFHSDF
jgi:hypothetical protein